MGRKYRLLYMAAGLAAVFLVILIEKNIGLASLAEEMFINSCVNITMPGVTYYCEPQAIVNDNLYDEFLRTTVPVSAMIPKNNDDYLMLADDICGSTNGDSRSDINNANKTDSNSDNLSGSGKATGNTTRITENDNNGNINAVGRNAPTSAASGDNADMAQNTDAQAATAIHKNEVTGTVYNKSELSDYGYVHNHFYTITSITDLTEDILRPSEFVNKDLSIDKSDGKPKILIFHTHSQEGFTDTVEGDASTTIVGVGDYLTALLTDKYGYNVIHDKTVYDYVDGRLDRSKAYTYAENGIARILEDNPSIEVVIDLHRDGVADTTHLVTEVDGKSMAKIMFFNGLSYSKVNGDITYLYNPYRDDNLAMSLQMQLLGEAYYPGFLRRIYVNAYRYCLHERARSMLIEAGAQTNTYEEVKNAMEPLADILDKLLSGQKVMKE